MSVDAEANKRAAVESYNLALNKKDADAAFKYLGPTYKQHNPTVADGFEGWRAMVNWLKADRPDFKVEIKRVIAEGDFVVLHVLMKIDAKDRGRAGVEIFRFETARSSNTGTSFSLSPRQPPITTRCSECRPASRADPRLFVRL